MASFRESIRVMVDRELSPAARSAMLADAARKGVADLVATGRANPRYTTIVDGRTGIDESAVRPDGGVILYEFAYMGEAAEFALEFLLLRAPAVSGRYRKGFMVAVNGRAIPARMFRKESVPASGEILIYNTEPYSRKIDVQLSGSRRLKYRTPPGLFEDAAKAVRGRYGNTVKAAQLYTVRFPGQTTNRSGRLVDSPALSIMSLG